MKKIFLTLITSSILSFSSFAQSADEQIFNAKNRIEMGTSTPERVIKFAKSFINRPYVAHTLEKNQKEALVCNFREVDCFTFVENVLALVIAKEKNVTTFANYQEILKGLRYRGGKIDGYGSRLHYFVEWARQAEKNGFLKNVTTQIGGEPVEKEINFMTKHRELYPKLADEKAFSTVMNGESEINKEAFIYIPKAKIAKIESKIKDGDIIAITSTIEGLDVNHEGFAISQNGRIYLLHASSERKEVVISAEPLADYLARIKKDAGIIVLRVQ